MMEKSEDYQNRFKKLEEIKKLGIDPYPAEKLNPKEVDDLRKKYHGHPIGSSEEALEGKTEEVLIAGRIVLFRAMGKNAFMQILDEKETIQVMFNREESKIFGLTSPILTPIKFVEKMLDLGDIVSIQGHLFRTKVGEITLFAKELKLLSKSLLPLPDKHSGLSDKGVRYRKRWLDLIANPEVMTTFQRRSKILSLVRRFYEDHGYMEVETPVLQSIYGGAEARPFQTHVNALHLDLFLRISLEIQLKKIICGGIRKVFEIAKVFRNEGMDKTHNPEFTMVESYAAYNDYHDIMDFTESLFVHLAESLYGTTNLGDRYDKRGHLHSLDLKGPWERISMKAAIKKYHHMDVEELSDEELREELYTTALDKTVVKNLSRGLLIAKIFEEFVEHHLILPTFIIDHPIETTPLCKRHRHPKERGEGLVERFELFILGMEMANAYSELNDPILQEELLSEQERLKQKGAEETHPMDREFIEALENGMPPCGGLGIGIDRLVMLLTGEVSIRDVLFFPLMKPEETLLESGLQHHSL